MNKQLLMLTSSLKELRKLLEREAQAIKASALEKIPSIAAGKSDLLAQLDQLSASLDADKIPAELSKELEIIKEQASRNATLLKALAEGAAAVRDRLRILNEEQFSTGVYQADGTAIVNPEARTIQTKL